MEHTRNKKSLSRNNDRKTISKIKKSKNVLDNSSITGCSSKLNNSNKPISTCFAKFFKSKPNDASDVASTSISSSSRTSIESSNIRGDMEIEKNITIANFITDNNNCVDEGNISDSKCTVISEQCVRTSSDILAVKDTYDSNLSKLASTTTNTTKIIYSSQIEKMNVNYNHSTENTSLSLSLSSANSAFSRKRKRSIEEREQNLPDLKRIPKTIETKSYIKTNSPMPSTVVTHYSRSSSSKTTTHSHTPNSCQSSSGSSSIHSYITSSPCDSSSLSPNCIPAEIDEFLCRQQQENDARSSSSYVSIPTGIEYDFVPSSDDSTNMDDSTLTEQHFIEQRSCRQSYKDDDIVNEVDVDQRQHQEDFSLYPNCKTPHKIDELQRALTPSSDIRPCPLPALSWANASDVWNAMCKNDEKSSINRTSSMLQNHYGLQPRMRAILLDWLIEVCEVYKLHRETYYLAVDYLDRYLSTQKNVQKTHLQLIGITCLFVAAKVEEIYPPKIGEFAYVTDGACREDDILQHELLLLSALDWSITPVTIIGWLGIYMQLKANNRSAVHFSKSNDIIERSSSKTSAKFDSTSTIKCRETYNETLLRQQQLQQQNPDKLCLKENNNYYFETNPGSSTCGDFNKSSINDCYGSSQSVSCSSGSNSSALEVDDAFIYPQFSGYEFSQTAQLIDLCTLDLGIADFSYSIIAAAAISFTFGKFTAMRVSGYEWSAIEKCAKWMEPFFDVIKNEAQYFFLNEQNDQVNSKHGLGKICPNIIIDESHMIQSHTTSISLLEEALQRREELLHQYAYNQPEKTPGIKISKHLCPDGLLTPPASSRKPIDNEDVYMKEALLLKDKT